MTPKKLKASSTIAARAGATSPATSGIRSTKPPHLGSDISEPLTIIAVNVGEFP
jgi:hypothetical protein